jgi:hypothetical protein
MNSFSELPISTNMGELNLDSDFEVRVFSSSESQLLMFHQDIVPKNPYPGLEGFKQHTKDIASTLLMRQLHLECNTEEKLLICTTCRQALTMKNIKKHIKDCQHHLIGKDTKKLILKEAGILGILPEVPVIKPTMEPRAPFAGIKIFTGLGCPACPTSGSLSTLSSHLSKMHRGPENGKSYSVKDLYPVHLQRLMPYQGHRNFRVTPDQDSTNNPPAPSQLHHFKAISFSHSLANRNQGLILDHAHVSPLVKFAKWHTGIKERDLSSLREMISLETNKLLYPHVAEGVIGYLEAASERICLIGDVTRQKLQTKDRSAE